MMTHSDYKYSITVNTDDLPVVGCLRALSKFSQKTGEHLWREVKKKRQRLSYATIRGLVLLRFIQTHKKKPLGKRHPTCIEPVHHRTSTPISMSS